MVKTVDPSPPILAGAFRNDSNSIHGQRAGRRGRSNSESSEDSYEADQRAADANRRLQERYKNADERHKRARLAYTKQDEDADNLCIQRSFDPVSKDFSDPDAFCYWRDDASNGMVRIFDRFTWEGLLATPQRDGMISHPIYGAKYSFDPAFVVSIISAPMQMEHRNLLLLDKAEYEGRKAAREELEESRKLYQTLHQELFGTDAPPPPPPPSAESIPLLLPNGTSERPFQPTTRWDDNANGKEARMDLQSISAMFTYQHYSFEELRLQDLMQGIHGNSSFGIPSFVFPAPTSSWAVTPSTSVTEIPFAGAAHSYSDMGTGQTVYLAAITGMNEYMHKSFEEWRLEDLLQARASANSGLETIFDSLDVGGKRMSDCSTSNDDEDERSLVFQSIVPYVSFEEIRFQATTKVRGGEQSLPYSYPFKSFEEMRFQAMMEEGGRRH